MVLTNGSGNLYAFTQVGDYFRLIGDVVSDVSDATITSSSFETAALSVPPSSLAHIYASADGSTGVSQMYVTVRTAGAADAGSALEAIATAEVTSTTNLTRVGGIGMVLVNGSSQIDYAALESAGTVNVRIGTLGWLDLKRSAP